MAEIEGLSDLAANIGDLNARLRAALPDIAMVGAEVLEAEIRARAPVDTGALVASLDAWAGWRTDAASATVAIEQSGPGGAEHYAIAQEFGNSRTSAQPFFRPGIEAARDKGGALMRSRILETIEK